MIVKFENGEKYIIAPELTQWDKGQLLYIEGMEYQGSLEMHITCKNMKNALRCFPLNKEQILVKIPDMLLKEGEEIRVYVYAVTPESGTTIYTIIIPVRKRAKPTDYQEPEEEEGIKQLIEEIRKKADNLQFDGEYLQLLSGDKEIGERIRLKLAEREIELKNDGESICWRYTDSNEWEQLILLSDIRGKDGETPKLEIRNGHLYAIYQD